MKLMDSSCVTEIKLAIYGFQKEKRLKCFIV